MTWLLVYQRPHKNATLSDAVAHSLGEFPADARPDCKRCRDNTLSANTGGYRAARTNLPDRVLETAAARVFDALVGAYPPSRRDRRAFILDGTTLSLVATNPLTATFTPASNQHGRSHWPVMHVVVAHELASGLAAAPQYGARYGPHAASEVHPAKRLLAALPARSILRADRNFGVFGFAHAGASAGHDVVVRLTAARFRAPATKGTSVGDGRWSLTWAPTRSDRHPHPQLAADAVVRGWLHRVHVRDDLTLWLLSTVDGTSAELAELYRQRADVETDIRNLRVGLDLDRMSGHDEAMVVKELWAALVTYNLTTQVRRLAAERLGVNPRRLSLAGVLSLVRVFASGWHAGRTEAECQARFDLLMRAAGQRKLPERKRGRSYPREVIPRRRKFPQRKRVKPTR